MKKTILKIVSVFVICLGLVFGGPILLPLYNASALPEDPNSGELTDSENTNENTTEEEGTDNNDNLKDNPDTETSNVCVGESGSVSWILCPVLNVMANVVDSIYDSIDGILAIKPSTMDQQSAIYQIWQKVRDITNVIFIIFILIVIYSQVTGLGLDNYGIKRVLPRIIIAVIMVNISYILTAILVDLSNIIGSNIVQVFSDIQASIEVPDDPFSDISWGDLVGSLTGGGVAAWLAGVAAGGFGKLLWMGGIALICALISVFIGIITIGLRQAVIYTLLMIAPLAFVAYLLPNTEKFFAKWKGTLSQMLFFYPMFAFLFGASRLISFAILHSAGSNGLLLITGVIIRVIPLVLSIKLLQMSDTVLGAVSAALNKATQPARAAISRWGMSHAEHAQKKYESRSGAAGFYSGAHLRKYLTNRQALRDYETKQLEAGNLGLTAAYVANRASSFRGYDEHGNAIYGRRPNYSTRISKRAANNALLSQLAESQLKNTLGEYNKIFTDRKSQALNATGGQAFIGLYGQSLRAENIATSDQNQLLGTYIDAIKSGSGSYSWNRLIRSSSISMGHVGEASLVGQVLMRSVEIEGRRKNEARVIGNKFNFPKLAYRAMVMDCAAIDDNGHEIDPVTGEHVDDDQFQIKEKEGYHHTPWQQYIGVHKKTGIEISKEQYDALSEKEKENYNRVRYCEVPDDDDKTVQKVFFDDPGYMKEYLARDIAVADPINRRYAVQIGLNHRTGETGPLRKYHSTITNAILESDYKKKDGGFTAMLMAQANLGNIHNMTHFNIAHLQSINASADPGSMNMNDAFVFKDLRQIIESVEDEELFKHFFKAKELKDYGNVNSEPLEGLRKKVDDATGKQTWESVSADDPTLTDAEKLNYIKHRVIAKTAAKLFGMADKISPNVADKQKPEALEELANLQEALVRIGLANLKSNEGIFDKKLNPEMNIFKTPDVKILSERAKLTRKVAAALRNNDPEYVDMDINTILQTINSKLANMNIGEQVQAASNNLDSAITDIESILNDLTITDYNTLASFIYSKFKENTILNDSIEELERIITKHSSPGDPTSSMPGANIHEENAERVEQFKAEISRLLNIIQGSQP